jgi:transposase
MIPVPAGAQIWVACGPTDMRRGFDGLAMMVQDVLCTAQMKTAIPALLFVQPEPTKHN